MIKKTEETELLNTIISAIHDKKGEDVVTIDLNLLTNRICDFFIICNANSNMHVQSIADGIYRKVKKDASITPKSFEGFENAQWVLLDYFNVIVHVFQTPYRQHYNIEELWGDGKINKHLPEQVDNIRKRATTKRKKAE